MPTHISGGNKRVTRIGQKDYRVRFNGEIRRRGGLWTQEECQRFLDCFNSFLWEQRAVYEDWVVLATPNEEA